MLRNYDVLKIMDIKLCRWVFILPVSFFFAVHNKFVDGLKFGIYMPCPRKKVHKPLANRKLLKIYGLLILYDIRFNQEDKTLSTKLD